MEPEVTGSIPVGHPNKKQARATKIANHLLGYPRKTAPCATHVQPPWHEAIPGSTLTRILPVLMAVWLAVEQQAVRPHFPDLPVRLVYFSGMAFTQGIETHLVEQVAVQGYTPAKTVADCFKYRHKIGLDVALEALEETWRARRATMANLWHSASTCLVSTVMCPYLETLP